MCCLRTDSDGILQNDVYVYGPGRRCDYVGVYVCVLPAQQKADERDRWQPLACVCAHSPAHIREHKHIIYVHLFLVSDSFF